MLKRSRLAACASALFLALTVMWGFSASAHADGCPPGTVQSIDALGAIHCTASSPPSSGNPTGPGPGVPTNCTGNPWPCNVTTSEGTWTFISGPCYSLDLSPQPPATDPAWGGKTPGQYVLQYLDCIHNPPSTKNPGVYITPGPCTGACRTTVGTTAGVLSQLTFPPPAVHMSPDSRTTNKPTIGFANQNVWFWTDAIDKTPAIKTDGAGLGMITGTKVFSGIDWKITRKDANGNEAGVATLHCEGTTAYDPSYGGKPSPDPQCGYAFTTPGQYTISVTMTWSVQFVYANGTPTTTSNLTSTPTTAAITIQEGQSTNG